MFVARLDASVASASLVRSLETTIHEYSLRVAYEYTWQEYAESTTNASSSAAMISVTYEPLQRRR